MLGHYADSFRFSKKTITMILAHMFYLRQEKNLNFKVCFDPYPNGWADLLRLPIGALRQGGVK
jgi:hypothetical protein